MPYSYIDNDLHAGYRIRHVRQLNEDCEKSLSHHGVQGMHWGEITKEYEPVAVDHRKIKTANNPTPARAGATFSSGIAKMKAARKQREAEQYKRDRQEMLAAREHRDKLARNLAYGGAIVAGLLLAYGTYKVTKIQRARAYSGLLNRIMTQNPNMSLSTASRMANFNTRMPEGAKMINRYLKSKNLTVGIRRSNRIYGAKNLISRMSKIPKGKTKAGKAIFNKMRYRMRDRIFDKLYF